jgi:hypothetical protein
MKDERYRMCVLKLRVCTNEAVISREQAKDFRFVLQVFIHCNCKGNLTVLRRILYLDLAKGNPK